MFRRRFETPTERILHQIEQRVLDEVWLSRSRRASGALITAILVVATATWWWDAIRSVSSTIPNVVASLLINAAGMSIVGLATNSYRYCCGAAYSCGLADVVGVGAIWWLRTGQQAAPLWSLVLGCGTSVLMTIGWLSVVMTPAERSQPDMRVGNGASQVRP